MRKVFIGVAIITALLTGFLLFNNNRLPTKDRVFKITENRSPAIEEVYLVRKIDGEWLTIFRNSDSIMIGRLERNWIGYWVLKDDLVSTYYPPEIDDELTWGALQVAEGESSYYFGQIINPEIKKIEIETQNNLFESALLISSDHTRFFYLKVDEKAVMPININGYSEARKLIYSTIKPIKED